MGVRLNEQLEKEIERRTKSAQIQKAKQYGESVASMSSALAQGRVVKGTIEAMRMASSLRKGMEQGKSIDFVVLLIFAVVVDIADFIPIVSLFAQAFYIVVIATKVLTLSTLFTGRRMHRMKWKIIIALTAEFIPGISYLPLNAMFILHWKKEVKKNIEESEQEIKSLEEGAGNLLDAGRRALPIRNEVARRTAQDFTKAQSKEAKKVSQNISNSISNDLY